MSIGNQPGDLAASLTIIPATGLLRGSALNASFAVVTPQQVWDVTLAPAFVSDADQLDIRTDTQTVSGATARRTIWAQTAPGVYRVSCIDLAGALANANGDVSVRIYRAGIRA